MREVLIKVISFITFVTILGFFLNPGIEFKWLCLIFLAPTLGLIGHTLFMQRKRWIEHMREEYLIKVVFDKESNKTSYFLLYGDFEYDRENFKKKIASLDGISSKKADRLVTHFEEESRK